jgi:hypothetical protein
MRMNWPQIVWFLLTFWGLLIAYARNGQATTVQFGGTVLSTIFVALLLWFGGFFG